MGQMIEWLVANQDMVGRWLIVGYCLCSLLYGVYRFLYSDEWKMSERVIDAVAVGLVAVPMGIVMAVGLIGVLVYGVYWGIWL